MGSHWRRFEVLLPQQFNDGREVPAEWLAEAVQEVVEHFGAACKAQKLEGQWRDGAVSHHDNLMRLVVDVPDTPPSREWMKRFKSRWKERLEQLELWMVSHRVEIE